MKLKAHNPNQKPKFLFISIYFLSLYFMVLLIHFCISQEQTNYIWYSKPHKLKQDVAQSFQGLVKWRNLSPNLTTLYFVKLFFFIIFILFHSHTKDQSNNLLFYKIFPSIKTEKKTKNKTKYTISLQLLTKSFHTIQFSAPPLPVFPPLVTLARRWVTSVQRLAISSS